jgi:CubicO group peptidase (beta-lactamase class C family)
MVTFRRFWNLNPISDFRTTYTYSNFMYLLCACVAERLGGASFEHLMRTRLLNPLNMHRSFFISEADVLPKSYILNQTTGLLHELDPLLLRYALAK